MTATDLKAGIYLPSDIEETGRPDQAALLAEATRIAVG